jgi:hypothetical protein
MLCGVWWLALASRGWGFTGSLALILTMVFCVPGLTAIATALGILGGHRWARVTMAVCAVISELLFLAYLPIAALISAENGDNLIWLRALVLAVGGAIVLGFVTQYVWRKTAAAA